MNWLLIKDNGDGTKIVANAIVLEDGLTPVSQSDQKEWIGWTCDKDGKWTEPQPETAPEDATE